jgi:hypothetical protein
MKRILESEQAVHVIEITENTGNRAVAYASTTHLGQTEP